MKINSTIILLFLTLISTQFASAQNKVRLTGTVTDIYNKAIADANITVRKSNNKTSIDKVKTDFMGNFNVSLNAIDKYVLHISYLGYISTEKEISISPGTNLKLDTIRLHLKEQLLEEVIVYGKINPMVLKGDTIEYNAKAYSLRNGEVIGNLINKISGFNLQSNGLLYSNGELITNITVNGKEFFKGEPLMAINNLPAEITSKLQVISSRKGTVDTKTLNIVTDKDKTTGTFGNQSVGAGTNKTKRAEVNLNKFKNDKQLSIIGNYGNIPGNDFFNLLEQGITTNTQSAINYSNAFKEHRFNISYSYNKSDQNLTQTIQTTTFYNDISNINNTSFLNEDKTKTDRINFSYDTKINKSLLVKVNANHSTSNYSNISLQSFTTERNNEFSKGTQNMLRDGRTPNIEANISLIKNFNSNKRNLQFNYSFINSKRGNESFNLRQQNNIAGTAQIENINQLLSGYDTLTNNTISINYSEKLTSKSKLYFRTNLSLSDRKSTRETFDYDTLERAYSKLNKNYSSNINDKTNIARNALSYEFTTTKLDITASLTAELINQQNTYSEQRFLNLLPLVEIQLKLKNQNRLSLNYNQRTNIPDINQIMPGGDNTNNNVVFIGNSNLKPSITQSINLTHNYFNTKTTNVLFTNIKIDQARNAIVPSYRYDELSNRNIIQFVNANNTINAMLNSLYSFPLSANKQIMLNIGVTGMLNSLSNISDGKDSRTNSLTINHNYRINANFKTFELIFNTSVSYNSISYQLTQQKTQEFYMINNNLSSSAFINPNLKISMLIDYRRTIGDNFLKDVNIVPINLEVSQQLLKSKKATIRIKANDLLNQNRGIMRTLTESSVSDRNYNVLGRYFFLSLSYKMSKFKGE
jgi:hypothetical protein